MSRRRAKSSRNVQMDLVAGAKIHNLCQNQIDSVYFNSIIGSAVFEEEMASDNENKASLGVNEEEVIGWIRSVLPTSSFSDEERSRAEIALASLSGAGGLSSAHMLKVTVKLDGTDRSSFVYKAHNEATVGMSKDMGLAREAYFYRDLSSVLRAQGVLSPLLIGAEGDMETGRFQILMEDLSQTAVQSGYFFGPGSPHNWGKDLTALTSAAASGTTLRDVSLDCFVQMARMHRFYWKKTELWGNSWLRGSSYFIGEGKSIWEGEQDRTNKAWEKCKQQMADGTSQIRFNEHLVQCIDASVAKLDWEQFLDERQNGPWTLVHGDMHPANIMWDYTRASAVEGAAVRGTSVFVDWQVVGIGSGPQDMAQYIISHTSPTDRRLIERELVLAYHKELTTGEGLPEDLRAYSFEQCWKDYVRGGTQRWVWLFCLITSICPAIVSQYFHDQLAAFLEDHGVTPENIGMPI